MQKNKNIYFLSADFGAPSLDIFRKELPNQFIHTGISEQNMIDIAIGLSIKKIVVNYAMAPFILARAWEQHKISSTMKLPMINLVPGIDMVMQMQDLLIILMRILVLQI